MNLKMIKNRLFQIKEIKLIGRTVAIGPNICHVMGLVREPRGIVKLLLLEYEPGFKKRVKQAKINERRGLYDTPVTNRMELRKERSISPESCFYGSVKKIHIGDIIFEINGSSSRVCHLGLEIQAVLFTRFLLEGWNISGIDTQDMDYLYLTQFELKGTYVKLPNIDSSAPIRFCRGTESKQHLVEQPITLAIGEDFAEKLYFVDKEKGKQHWLQINQVYLWDIWTEMKNPYDDPSLKEHLSAQELLVKRAEFESDFLKVCPKGMCYPAIKYECEEEIHIQFHSKSWLDTERPKNNSSRRWFFLDSSNKSVGKLGQELKTGLIQEPFPAETKEIEIELFCYYTKNVQEDIII